MAEYNFCCYCGRQIIHPLKDTSEHLVPLSRGGNNKVINKKRCCNWCNSWRSNHSLEDFKQIVQHCLNNNIKKRGLKVHDYWIILENIDYWQDYINKHKEKLLR